MFPILLNHRRSDGSPIHQYDEYRSYPNSPLASPQRGRIPSDPIVGYSKASPQEIYYSFPDSDQPKIETNLVECGGPGRDESFLMVLHMSKVRIFEYILFIA